MKHCLFKISVIAAWLLAHSPASAAPSPVPEVLLLSHFRDNGKDGILLASSGDGAESMALNDDRPVFAPPMWPGQSLMPSAARQMVWCH